MVEIKNEFKKTEAGYIPVEWAAKSLNDISEINKGKQLSKLNMLGGEYYVLNGGQVPSGYHNTFNTPENTISISEGGNSCGFVKFNKEKFWSGGHNYTLSLRENINILFLYHYLKYKENIIMSLRVGSGLPNIQKKALQNFYISVPPLKEQQKIAAILSTVDEQLEQTNQLIEKTKELKKGLMQHLLTKGIGHTEFKQSELGEIPDEWEVISLKDITEKIGDGIHSTPKYNEEGTIPFINGNNIKDGVVYISEKTKMIDELEFSKYQMNLKNNSILLSINGTIGNVGIYSNERVLLGKSAAYLNPTNNINTKYLYYVLNSYYIKSYFTNELTGTTIRNLSLKSIKAALIMLPSLNEQKKIADILTSVDEDIEGYQDEKAKYEELKKGLMQQLLTGKTRVKVD